MGCGVRRSRGRKATNDTDPAAQQTVAMSCHLCAEAERARARTCARTSQILKPTQCCTVFFSTRRLVPVVPHEKAKIVWPLGPLHGRANCSMTGLSKTLFYWLNPHASIFQQCLCGTCYGSISAVASLRRSLGRHYCILLTLSIMPYTQRWWRLVALTLFE